MREEIGALFDETDADDSVRAVIVTGAGKAFCAGADLTALGAATEDGLRGIYDGFLAVANCALPTIAAVNGAAVGAGLNLALAALVLLPFFWMLSISLKPASEPFAIVRNLAKSAGVRRAKPSAMFDETDWDASLI